jgi:hypothetical protein
MCATVVVMTGRFHRLRDHGAVHLALIAFVCFVTVLLSGSAPAQLAGTDWLARQIDNRVEQIEAPDHTAAPMAPLDIRATEGPLSNSEQGDLPELTDDDETEYCLLRLDVAALGSQSGRYESSADRALIRLRLRAFSTRAP